LIGIEMLFRQLFDQDSSTYSYLLADQQTGDALIIDPVIEQLERDATLIDELGLKLLFALDTHVHADHVTATGALRQRFGSRTVVSERAGVACADWLVKHGDRIRFGAHELEVRETPGHTRGCLTYVMHQPRLAFTGDALLIRACGRTDFQQGDSRELYRSVREQVFTLPGDTLIYPGHDYKGRTVSSVAEEKRLNPRLGGERTSSGFERLMSELRLPYPRKMDVAVPANLFCGVGSGEVGPGAEFATDWAPLESSAAGIPELTADWLAPNVSSVRVLDVREPDEYRGDLGHVPGAELVPLETLPARAATLPRDRPIVTVCRSGGRSGKAALELARRGFWAVASLRGGMTDWNARGLPVEHGAPPASVTNRQG
jgi:sulfur dioxygenase